MGGTIAANNVARRLSKEIRQGSVKITMLSASDQHWYQPGLLYVAFGKMALNDICRDQSSLLEPGIKFFVDPVEEFEISSNRVRTKAGVVHDYDMLVIATGCEAVYDEVPGLKESSETPYTRDGAVSMFKKLRDFEGGKVAVVVGVPHKCPIAPIEITFMLHEFFEKRGIRDKVDLQYTYPIARIHNIENIAKWAIPEFARMEVGYETFFNMKEVDVENKIVHSEEGTEKEFDLLVAVPPHRGMQVIEDNNLGDGGWIPTDRYSLRMDGQDNVFVLGDTTNLPISKTGSTAHFESEVIGENIASLYRTGTATREYDGKVYCFIEADKDRATNACFNYIDPPEIRPPTKSMHMLKMSYNQWYWSSARGLL
jgi:sulfide:quinone oxidoreductase